MFWFLGGILVAAAAGVATLMGDDAPHRPINSPPTREVEPGSATTPRSLWNRLARALSSLAASIGNAIVELARSVWPHVKQTLATAVTTAVDQRVDQLLGGAAVHASPTASVGTA